MPDQRLTEFVKFEELFWNVTRDMGKMWNEIFGVHFPGSQSYLVFTLARKGPLKMSELAQILGLTAGAVTAASDKLIENGYVTRIRDEQDRRIVYLGITDQGRELMQQLRELGRAKMSEAFSHLDDDKLPTVIAIFEQAAFNISSMKGSEQ